jgi:hypothetical protein
MRVLILLAVLGVVGATSMTSCLNGANSMTSVLSSRVRTFWEISFDPAKFGSTTACAMFQGKASDLAMLRTLTAVFVDGTRMQHEHFQVAVGDHVCLDLPRSTRTVKLYSKDFADRIVDCQQVRL